MPSPTRSLFLVALGALAASAQQPPLTPAAAQFGGQAPMVAFPFEAPPLPSELVRSREGPAQPRFREATVQQPQMQVQQQQQQQQQQAMVPETPAVAAAMAAAETKEAFVATRPYVFETVKLPEPDSVLKEALLETGAATMTETKAKEGGAATEEKDEVRFESATVTPIREDATDGSGDDNADASSEEGGSGDDDAASDSNTPAASTEPIGSEKPCCNAGGESSGEEEPGSKAARTETIDPDEARAKEDETIISDNPEIKKKQEEYYAKQKEVREEKAWVAKIRKVIREYQNKVLNVEAHAREGHAHLGSLRREINHMVRSVKQEKLNEELAEAVEALKKLEAHSGTLNAKISELSDTKQGLRNTIGRIRLALGKAAGESYLTEERFREMVLAKPPSQNELVRFKEKIDANTAIKQHIGSLLELIEKNHREDERAERHENEEVHATAQVARTANMHEHKHEADISVATADVDPSVRDEELDREFGAILRDTAENENLD